MSDPAEAAWPPLVGDFVLGDPASPVAVCTLASRGLLAQLAGRPEIAIAGRVYTENVGVERMVQNLVANPRLRVLILCGRESPHGAGQTILSLHRNGLDGESRVIGARSAEPFLPNLGADELRLFRERVELIDLIGELDPEKILACAHAEARTVAPDPADLPARPAEHDASRSAAQRIRATPDDPGEWRYDAAGFFLIFVDREAAILRAEQYSQDRKLLHIVEGRNAREICHTLVRLGLVTELAHAAYLGTELGRAESALRLGLRYDQDSPLDPGRRA
jgi:tetrahydromethanopterin S-methyltransferase subunit A